MQRKGRATSEETVVGGDKEFFQMFDLFLHDITRYQTNNYDKAQLEICHQKAEANAPETKNRARKAYRRK